MLAFRVPPRRPFGPPGARPACPVRAPFGAVRGASAVCSAMSAPFRRRASPPPFAARLRLAGGGARFGRPGLRPASRAPARFRASPPGRFPPRLRWPWPSGAGPRPSLGASLPPAAAPAPPLRPFGLGGGRGPPRTRGSCALPSARSASPGRPPSAPGAAGPPARLRLRRVPPFRPAPAGRLRPRSSAPGAARRPTGGFLAASRPPAPSPAP